MSMTKAFGKLVEDLAVSAAAIEEAAEGLEQVEGYHHLLRLISAATDLHVERADPRAPRFTVWMNPTRKFLGDNPDTIYSTAPIEGGGAYELRIGVGNAVYVGVVVYGRTAAGWRVISSANDSELVRTDDGLYALALDELDVDAVWVMVREYFADRNDKRAAILSIERTDRVEGTPLRADVLAERLTTMSEWIRTQIDADVFLSAMQLGQPNQPPDLAGVTFPPSLVAAFLPTPDVDYQGCAFELAEGQRLVVRGVAPDARYWGLQVMNRWLESVDGRSGWNNFELGLNAGDPFEIVLGDRATTEPPSVALDGRRRGLLAFRTLVPAGPVPRVTFDVV